MYSTGYYCQILIKLEFSSADFRKILKYNFFLNPCSDSRVVPLGTDGEKDRKRERDRQTDRHDKTNNYLIFRNFAKAPKNYS